jgi:nucleotide-binding universal stress UspA family protein
VKGEPTKVVAEYAKSADATVFTPETAKYSVISENVFDAALLRSGRPVFYLPQEKPDDPVLSRALIAWDGRSACARAISAWLNSGIALDHAAIVHVVDPHEGQPETASVQAHLTWHGVVSDVETPDKRLEPVGKVLLDTADRMGCGLIVMGGYGHFRNWEAVFGGVTRYMIRHATLPLLMMH